MDFKTIIIICTISIASAVAQISPAFFGATFPSGFVNPFSDLGSPQSSAFPNQGAPRSSTGPILFPPAPESRETSGVVVGASGFGFVPPGQTNPARGRGLPPPFPSFGSSPYIPSYYHI